MTPEITFTDALTVALVRHSGTDAGIAEAAWVSTSAAAGKTDDDVAKLIPYLVRHRHGVPFEHATITVSIHAPIFTTRQLLKHRAGVSISEESGRYVELEPVFYVPGPDRPMVAAAGHKAARPNYEPAEGMKYVIAADAMREAYTFAWKQYRFLIVGGIAREVARNVLPVSIYSSAYVTLNTRALMHFLSLRTKRDDAAVKSFPQYEINQVADQLEAIFAELWPVTHAAFQAAGRVAP